MKLKLFALLFLLPMLIFADKKQNEKNRLNSLSLPLVIENLEGNSLANMFTIRDAKNNKIEIYQDLRRKSKTRGKLFSGRVEFLSGTKSLNLHELKTLKEYLEKWLKDEDISHFKQTIQDIKKLIKEQQ